MSGDETLGATAQAIKDVAAQTPADARYVFMVSDANLRRYGISPATLGAQQAFVMPHRTQSLWSC